MARLAKDAMKPLGPPKLGRKTIKFTSFQLAKHTWPDRKASSKQIAVRSVKTGTVKKSSVLPPDTPFYRVICYTKPKGHNHKVTIFLPEGQPLTTKSHVIVDCTCADHAYTFEYALAKKYGNAFIWRCNGEPPLERNPGKRAGTCKHVFMSIRHLLRLAKNKSLVSKSRIPVRLSLRRG